MDLLAKDKVSLLTLPPTDLKEGLPISSTSPEKASNNAPLVLLQLPSGWKPADLQQTRLMGGGQQAALVSDTQSFAVNRVETSNVLVMVPPTERSTKRSKVREDGRAMEARPCRLLKVGGSGAFFLELRETTLSVQRLAEALQNCVYEPYSSSTVAGRTIEELSLELQAPRAQIEQSLQRMQAFRVPDTDSYAILAEEAKLECLSAIVATLAEVDAYADYAEAGMDADTLVEDVVRHMSREERFTGVHAVVRHCLATLANDTLDTDRIKLDVHKVAAFVARRLFQRQTQPWDETLFLSRWQSELPGVGNLYQVQFTMLRGIAIDIHNNEGERFWKYLPPESLSADPTAGFARLFAEKEKWRLAELQPYLERYTYISSEASLLLRFTRTVTEELDEVPVELYTKKL